MSLKVSEGLRDYLLSEGSLKDALDGGHINIYSGVAPTTAGAAIGSAGANVLLCTITNNGTATGINFDSDASSGVLAKDSSEVWKGVNVATGVASFYRHVASDDDGTLSTTQPRLQGSISTFGAEMNLSSTSLTSSADQTIDHYVVAIPTL